MRPAAGTLSQRITIERATTTQDAVGQPIATWSTVVDSVPARVEAVTGGETLRGRQVSAEASLVLTVRYRSDITPRMRVGYEGRTLGIVRASDPDGTRTELRIECREVL